MAEQGLHVGQAIIACQTVGLDTSVLARREQLRSEARSGSQRRCEIETSHSVSMCVKSLQRSEILSGPNDQFLVRASSSHVFAVR